jgi:hypothetical protein
VDEQHLYKRLARPLRSGFVRSGWRPGLYRPKGESGRGGAIAVRASGAGTAERCSGLASRVRVLQPTLVKPRAPRPELGANRGGQSWPFGPNPPAPAPRRIALGCVEARTSTPVLQLQLSLRHGGSGCQRVARLRRADGSISAPLTVGGSVCFARVTCSPAALRPPSASRPAVSALSVT